MIRMYQRCVALVTAGLLFLSVSAYAGGDDGAVERVEAEQTRRIFRTFLNELPLDHGQYSITADRVLVPDPQTLIYRDVQMEAKGEAPRAEVFIREVRIELVRPLTRTADVEIEAIIIDELRADWNAQVPAGREFAGNEGMRGAAILMALAPRKRLSISSGVLQWIDDADKRRQLSFRLEQQMDEDRGGSRISAEIHSAEGSMVVNGHLDWQGRLSGVVRVHNLSLDGPLPFGMFVPVEENEPRE